MQWLCSFKLHFVACMRQVGGTSCKTASCIVTTTTKQAGKWIKFLPASIMLNSLIDTDCTARMHRQVRLQNHFIIIIVLLRQTIRCYSKKLRLIRRNNFDVFLIYCVETLLKYVCTSCHTNKIVK